MTNFKQRANTLVSQMTLAEKIAQMRYDAPAIERLGVPAYNWWNECLHGVARAGCATVFPQAIGMAASFNTELMNRVASAISDEARAKYNQYKSFTDTLIYQGITMWSPNINIFRDPRWGRGHETYGEDPYLTGEMGVAFIKGLQEGKDPKYRKVDATIKHYAVHSGPEKKRHEFNAVVSERDLEQTYLRAFKYCIDNADPSAVMGAYNAINGEPACASKTYLKEMLYETLGFKGYVVSDCGAICDINKHHKMTENEAQSAALAINNGCQLNCGDAYKWVKTAVAMGLVSEETITRCVEKLFEARFRLGMFDDDCVYDDIPYDIVECKEHEELNLEMARESMVLLKNNGILPLDKNMKVAVIGPNSDDKTMLLGNYNGTPSKYYTLLRGIQECTNGQVIYARGCHLYQEKTSAWAEQPLRESILAAMHSDVVIMCMGINGFMEGEEGDAYNVDMSGDKRDLNLPLPQRELYEEILKTGKPVVFVNVSGSCINLTRQDETADAIVQCFYPGAMGGKALADILFGNVSPSGKLPVTFYRSDDDLPDFEDYSMENRTYRYFKGDPLYPFGYGLSYTKFEYDPLKIENKEVFTTVKNTGNTDGQTVIQIYRKFPGLDDMPISQLVAFKKVFLRKGEKTRVAFVMDDTENLYMQY